MNKRFNWLYIYSELNNDIYIFGIAKFITSLMFFVTPFLSLLLTGELGMNESFAGLIITLFNLTYIPGAIVGGKLADKYSKKSVLVISQLISAFFIVSFVFTNITIIKIILIMLSNLAISASHPAINSFISEVATPEQKKASYSYIYLCQNIGVAVGATMGGLLFTNYLNLLFILDSLTTILSALMILVFVKQVEISNKQNVNILEKRDLNSIKVLLKYPNLAIFSVVFAMYNFCYAQRYFTLPLYLKDYFGSNGVEYYATLMTFNALSVIFLTPLITYITQNYKSLINNIMAGIALGVGFGMYYISKEFITLAIATIIWSVGEILIATNFIVYVTDKAPKEYLGRISSMISVIANMGRYFNPIIMGIIIKSYGTLVIWPVMFFLMIPSSIVMLFLHFSDEKVQIAFTTSVDKSK